MTTRRVVLGLVLLTVIYLAWGGLYIYRTSFVLDGERIFVLWDDAMISMRYAANLADGEGLRWNAGEQPVQGFSNLALTLALALLHLLPIDATRISLVVQLANLAGLAALVLSSWRLARTAFPQDPPLATLCAVATALCAPLSIWGLQGADTTAVCLWLVGAVLIYARTAGSRPGLLFPFLALGLLIRLDTALFGLVFTVAACMQRGNLLRTLLWSAGSYGTVLAGMLGFSLAYYGDPLPNTFYLKATGMPLGRMLASGLTRFVYFWYTAVPGLLLAAFAAVRLRSRPLVPLCAALVAMAFVYDIRVGSDWAAEYGSRFIVPVLPLLLLLVCAGGRQLLREGPQVPLREAIAGGFRGTLLILVVCYFASPVRARVEWLNPVAPTMFVEDNQRNARLGLYLRDHTAPATKIAVHWGGLPAYLSGRPAIDVLGKSDRHIAKLEVSRFAPGHSKWDWHYVLMERRPDIFLKTSRGLDRVPYFAEHYRRVNSGEVTFYVSDQSLDLIVDPAAIVDPQGQPQD